MTQSIRKILVGFDGEDDSVITRGFELARREPHSELHVLRVMEPLVEAALIATGPMQDPDELDRLQHQLEDVVQAEIARQGDLRIAAVVAHLSLGSPAHEIVDLARRIDADEIVVGTHGRRGISRAVLGSVAEKVVRLAGCSVVVCRPKSHPTDGVPQVEPLCGDCAKTRKATANQKLWCERHSEHHPRPHAYSYEARSSEAARPWGFHG